jgi:mannonate dehydratase
MNRRKFMASTGAVAVALSSGCTSAAAASGQRVLMKLGCQSAPTNETHLQYFARYGVRNICGYPEIAEGRLYATVDELKRMLDLAEKSHISIDCVAPPFLASTHIDQTPHPAIMLADSPERDRDIEALQTFIRNCASAGIPSIKYNLTLLGVLRTQRTPGRGDAMYSTWRLKDAHPKSPLTRAGRVDADMFWERIPISSSE